jgi:hypothetical protein
MPSHDTPPHLLGKLLLDEPPLQVLPSLACIVGINQAVIIQQLHYYVRERGVERHGEYWYHQTYRPGEHHMGWITVFPWMNPDYIRQLFAKLKKDGFVHIERLSGKRGDRTNWYRPDYGKLRARLEEEESIRKTTQNGSEENLRMDAKKTCASTCEENLRMDAKKTCASLLGKEFSNSELKTVGAPEAIFKAYPIKTGKADAMRAIREAMKVLEERGEVPPGYATWGDWLLTRVKLYADCRRRHEESEPDSRRYIKFPGGWFRGGFYDDDERDWEPVQKGTSNGKKKEVRGYRGKRDLPKAVGQQA